MNEERFKHNLELWSHNHPKEALLLPYHACAELHFSETEQEAHAWFSTLDLHGIKVLYVYGVGFGHAYNAAQKWLRQDPDRFLVFLEDDLSVIYRLFETEKGTKILGDDQVRLHYFQGVEDAGGVLEESYWHNAMAMIQVSALNFYAETKEEKYSELHHKLLYDFSVKNALLDEYLKYGVGFFRNYYHNMLQLHRSFLGTKFFGQFKGVPAIICGAGPSLEKNMAQLGALTNRALIFAGGSALNALNAQDILPHFGAGIDPNAEQYKRLSENRAFEVPFFYRPRMFHPAFMQIHGPRLYIPGAGGYDVSEWFEKRFGIESETFDEGHNVVNFCTYIAYAMGCSPLIFVGMDLAFTEMKAYAKGIVADASVNEQEILQKERFDDSAIIREDIYGEPTYTLWKWVAEAKWLGDFTKEYPTAMLINATEGGLGFPGVTNRPLEEVAKQYLNRSYDLRSWVHGEIQGAAMPQVTKEEMIQAVQELDESLERCQEHLRVLLEDAQSVGERIKKEKAVPEIIQSGRAALAETDLAEESGYQYVLDIFNAVYARVLNQELQHLNASSLSEEGKAIKKLEIQAKKYVFLKEVAQVNCEIIKMALNDE